MTVNRHVVDPSQLNSLIRHYTQNGIGFFTGTESIYIPSEQTKFVANTRLTDWPDLDGVVYPMSPTEIARLELKREFPNLKRVGWYRSQTHLFDWRMPMAYRGEFYGWASHIDLVGAYHQIYRRLWLDVGFPSGFGNLSLTKVANRLSNHKPARNSLVGIIRSRSSNFQKGVTQKKLFTKNKYLSPCLWAFIQAVLNEIAFHAWELGAMYVVSDGYIIPDYPTNPAKDFCNLLRSFNLEYRIKEGHTHIKGWSSYQSALKSTTPYKQGKEGGKVPFYSIKLADKDRPLKMLSMLDKARDHKERTGQ